jgi:hypothetical protein
MADRRTLALACAITSFALVFACGTGASSPDACRSVMEAQCRRAPACNIPLEPPYSATGSTVDACIRFYDVACLHGLEVGNPGANEIKACVAAISNLSNDCGVVATPQNVSACSWLIPPAAATTSDAAAEATAQAAIDAAEDTAAE